MNQNSNHKMQIRKLISNDARRVSDLIRKTLKEVNSKDYPQDVIQNLYDNYSPENIIEQSLSRLIFVACDDDGIVGTVSLKDDTIYALFVDSKVLNQGIGIKLMNHVESLAQRRGYQLIRLTSSTTAYAFYQKLGYQAIKHEYSQKTGQVITMEKQL